MLIYRNGICLHIVIVVGNWIGQQKVSEASQSHKLFQGLKDDGTIKESCHVQGAGIS